MPTARPRVLIVDDEPTVRATLEMALSGDGLDVLTATSAEEALAQWPAGGFALLITDKNLPGISGVDLLRRLRGRGDRTPALIVTAFASAKSALETLNLGVVGYLEKPFADIFAVIEKAKAAIANGPGPGPAPAPAPSLSAATQHFGKATQFLTSASAALGRLRIVIAIRDASEARWLAGRLGRAGDDVVTAATGAAALGLIAAATPDLVIVDHAGSEAELLALLGQVQRACPGATRVVAAKSPTLTEVIGLIDLGVRAVLEKPFDEAAVGVQLAELVATLRGQKS